MASTAPVITIKQLTYDKTTSTYAIDDTVTDHNKWAPGVVKAGQESNPLYVAVFNNFANTEDTTNPIADMIECSVTALDSNGAKLEDIYNGSWINVNVNEDQNEAADGEQMTSLGADGDQAIWNRAVADPNFKAATGDAYHREMATPVDDAVIKGTVTTKDVDATLADTSKYALCKFVIKPPAEATPGSKGFKIRFQGYYV